MRKTNLKSKKGKSSDNESVVDDSNENGEEDASRGSISGDEEDKPELKKKHTRKSGNVHGKEDDAFVREDKSNGNSTVAEKKPISPKKGSSLLGKRGKGAKEKEGKEIPQDEEYESPVAIQSWMMASVCGFAWVLAKWCGASLSLGKTAPCRQILNLSLLFHTIDRRVGTATLSRSSSLVRNVGKGDAGSPVDTSSSSMMSSGAESGESGVSSVSAGVSDVSAALGILAISLFSVVSSVTVGCGNPHWSVRSGGGVVPEERKSIPGFADYDLSLSNERDKSNGNSTVAEKKPISPKKGSSLLGKRGKGAKEKEGKEIPQDEEYEEKLRGELILPNPVEQGDNVIMKAKQLTWALWALQDAMKKSILAVKGDTKAGNRPWNDRLQSLRARVRITHRRYQRCLDPAGRERKRQFEYGLFQEK
uniref:Uncharacterized protein n=1 Tax=Timema tahoe TaxID=61484 RepID=A0A7R9P0Y8_9NEOP|nr:unnamed protein product [Timema tahoe]